MKKFKKRQCVTFNKESESRCALNHLWTSILMFESAGMTMMQFLGMVARHWRKAGEHLLTLENPDKKGDGNGPRFMV